MFKLAKFEPPIQVRALNFSFASPTSPHFLGYLFRLCTRVINVLPSFLLPSPCHPPPTPSLPPVVPNYTPPVWFDLALDLTIIPWFLTATLAPATTVSDFLRFTLSRCIIPSSPWLSPRYSTHYPHNPSSSTHVSPHLKSPRFILSIIWLDYSFLSRRRLRPDFVSAVS